jgi:hypothetical protein
MKLRIRGNSLRLRLLQSELAAFVRNGKISEQIGFGNAALTYTLVAANDAETISAKFADNEITVAVPAAVAEKWAAGDQTSLEAVQNTGHDGSLTILIEKDFVCVTRADDPDNKDAFPNPNVNC